MLEVFQRVCRFPYLLLFVFSISFLSRMSITKICGLGLSRYRINQGFLTRKRRPERGKEDRIKIQWILLSWNVLLAFKMLV